MIFRVKYDAAGPAHDGASWATAYRTLQDALANTSFDDEVWVAAGTYTPGSTRAAAFNLPSTVRLYGGFKGTETARDQRNWRVSVTTLSGDIGISGDASDNSFHVVRTIGADLSTVIDGFTISDGNANGSYPDNHSGGGLYNQDGFAQVQNVMFTRNRATEGGAMANLRSSVRVTNVVFANNIAAVIGGGMTNYSSAPQLVNVTFSANHAQYGGGMDNTSSSPALINVVFSGNAATAQGGGGAINSWGGRPTLQNCILWGNTDDTNAQIINLNGAVTTVQYSLVAGGYAGIGNLNADPRFVDADGLDNVSGTLDDNLRLRADSPAIDAGNNSAVPAGITTDLDSNARFVDQPFVRNTGAGTAPIVDMGAYEVTYHPIYVDADATGTNDGTSWANAYTTLQAALAGATRGQGTVILVAEGTYTPGTNRTDSFRLVDGVAVYGGFGGTEAAPEQRDLLAHPTILSGNIGSLNTSSDNSYHVVTNDVAHAILDGFVIVNGNANAASYPDNSGGGIMVRNGSPFLSSLIFLSNAAINGGGLYNGNSSASVHNAVFSGNTASAGGAFYSTNGSPTVSNTVFSRNAAPSGGAIFAVGSNAPVMRNSILWGNGTGAISGTINIAYSIVQGGAAGAGNKDADPRFVDADGSDNIVGTVDDNLRLRAGSPAIDAGDNAAVPGDVTIDRDGNPRFVDDHDVGDTGRGSPPLADMGPYEYAPVPPSAPPNGLNATPASRSSIALSWSDNSDNESSFTIERSPDGGSGWIRVGRVGANSTIFTDTGRLCQTPYFYRVYASNASGVSAPSNTASATILDCTLDPPNNLTAAPASPSSILLTWSDNSDNEGGFRVERSPDGVGGWIEIGQVPANQIWFVDTSVTCGPPLFYRVHASNPGAVSAYTNVASTSVCPPDAPTDLTATTSSRMGVTLTWIDNSFNESGFAIERSLDGANNWIEIERLAANVTAYGSRGLDCNTTYFYRVRAFHLGGASPYSNIASAMTAACVPQTIYVNAAATGANDGQSWASAYTNLQDAMTAAIAADEIWVAAGTYNPGSKRSDTFLLMDGAAVYGGFTGTETARDQRDWQANVTVLNGYSSNYHVVASTGSGSDAILDGFTVQYGRADGNVPDRGGAGMYNDHGSPTVRNIIFSNNYALGTGAGMLNVNGSNPTLINVIFEHNTAVLGGGMQNYQSGATLRGVIFRNNSASTTQISGGGGLLLWDHASATLTDVSFENNVSGFFGGGIHCENSTITITRASFIGNRASGGGGGLSTLNSTATISDVIFANNVGGEGGGFRNDNSITTIQHAIFRRNTAGGGGGGIAHRYAGALTLYEAVFAGNSADWGGGIYFALGESSTISNATFVGNSAWYGASGLFSEFSRATVKNSIFWNNTGSASVTNANVSYSLMSDRPGGTGNITADPRFVDADGADNVIGTADDNLHLRAGSPAIDAGDNTALLSDSKDLDGDPRFLDDPTTPDTGNGTAPLVDMGAYEYQLDQPLNAPTNLTVTLALRAHITLSWTDNSDNERGFTIERSADGVGGWVEIGHVATNVTTYTDRLLPCGTTYFYRVRASNDLGNSGFAETRASTAACEPTTVYVNIQATAGANHGGSWHDAYTNLQDALRTAVGGDQIWVAAGTYTPGTLRTDTFVITSGIELYGGFSGTETAIEQRDWQINRTILSGDLGKAGDSSENSYHVVTMGKMSVASVIDGFTISGGNADRAYTDDTGAGLSLTNAHLVLRHDLIAGNIAARGGGIASESSAVSLEDMTFTDNQASAGGGVYAVNTSAFTLTNVVFQSNRAVNHGLADPDQIGGAGILSSQSRLTLEHVTFERNRAFELSTNGSVYGGGLASFGGILQIHDATFIGNLGRYGGGMFNGSSNAIIHDIVFRDNIAKFGGGLLNQSDELQMTNARFVRNTADGGGGMQSTGRGSIVSNSIFTGNTAYVGGGLYNSAADTRVSNTIFSGNSAQVGGAMYNVTASSPTISSVTISGNTAAEAAGAIFDYTNSTVTVRNSILWGNTAPSGAEIVDSEPTPTMIQYSLIQGGFDGVGNIAADPQFMRNPAPGSDGRWGTADDDYGDLGLRADSPAIDAGDNSAVLSDTVDLDSDGDTNELMPIDLGGHDRLQDDSEVADTGHGIAPIVDLGAYEGGYSPPLPAPVSHLNVQITGSAEQVQPGDSVTYRVAVTNAGPAAARSVTVTTTLPEGITLLAVNTLPHGGPGWTCAYANSSRKYVCTRTDLAVGSAPEITFSVTVTTHGSYMITTEVDSATSPHDGGSDPISAQIPVIVHNGFKRTYLPFVRR